jgi:biopolymer transport protein ExbB/TolQ
MNLMNSSLPLLARSISKSPAAHRDAHNAANLSIVSQPRSVAIEYEVANMSVNDLAKMLGDACYGFLAINFFWGLYNIIMAFRRLRELSFANHEEHGEFLQEIMDPLNNRNYEAAQEICRDDSRALPQLVDLAVENRNLSHDQLRQVITEVVQRDVMGDLEYRTNWIATVIKAGPLLGLFGTVLGMMAAFGRIGTGEKVQPSQIADEISIALICTAMGLGTAIPFNFLLSSLNGRIRSFQDALGAGLVRVFEFLKPR